MQPLALGLAQMPEGLEGTFRAPPVPPLGHPEPDGPSRQKRRMRAHLFAWTARTRSLPLPTWSVESLHAERIRARRDPELSDRGRDRFHPVRIQGPAPPRRDGSQPYLWFTGSPRP